MNQQKSVRVICYGPIGDLRNYSRVVFPNGDLIKDKRVSNGVLNVKCHLEGLPITIKKFFRISVITCRLCYVS